MGNTLGGKRTTKIMKINGETIKLKTPVQAGQVTKDYPGYVLLESESVKHFGVRAKPLGLYQELKPKRLYFLVQLPKLPEEKAPRKVRSGINMSAKDRLEGLMLARRSVSDLSLLKPKSNMDPEEPKEVVSPVRLKMRLPKAEVERLMKESSTEAEVAEKIMQLCLANNNNDAPNNISKGLDQGAAMVHSQGHWKEGGHGLKARKKRVGFLPVNEGEVQLAVA